MWVIRENLSAVKGPVYEVGYFKPSGEFYVLQGVRMLGAAAQWVNYLNGGTLTNESATWMLTELLDQSTNLKDG